MFPEAFVAEAIRRGADIPLGIHRGTVRSVGTVLLVASLLSNGRLTRRLLVAFLRFSLELRFHPPLQQLSQLGQLGVR